MKLIFAYALYLTPTSLIAYTYYTRERTFPIHDGTGTKGNRTEGKGPNEGRNSK